MLDPTERLAQLAARYPLPDPFRLQEPVIERLRLGPLDLGMIGLVATSPGTELEAIGAAGGHGPVPVERAYFEVLERICTLLAMDPCREAFREVDARGRTVGTIERTLVFPEVVQSPPGTPSFTNGVALHRSYAGACRNALFELVERDSLLRAWYGWAGVTPVALPESPFSAWARAHYRLLACGFGHGGRRSGFSAGLLALPKDPKTTPLLFSSGGGTTLAGALASAEREILQRLCFLWGEAIPAQAPQFSASVDYHQAYYLVPDHHALLERFVRGGHKHLVGVTGKQGIDPGRVRFADLSADGTAGGLRVVRAVCPDALLVLFGHDRLATGLPVALQVHPIS